MDWTDRLLVQIRKPDLTFWGQLEPEDIDGLVLTPRFNKLGGWAVSLPADSPAAEALRSPGWGLVVLLDGDTLLSGPMYQATLSKSAADPVGVWALAGYDDSVILSDELAWPSPATTNIAAQTGTAGSGYDERGGSAETVLKGYVNANIGPAAPAGRRNTDLTIQSTVGSGSGSVVDATGENGGRFQQLGALLSTLATSGGVGFRVRQVGFGLRFEVFAPSDLTGLIRLDVDNATIDTLTYTYQAPIKTHAIVAGDGADADRILRMVTTTDSLDASTLWGRRVESFESSSGADDDVLDQTGADALATDGQTQVGLSIAPIDTDLVQFSRDYYLGDRVTVVVDPLMFPPSGEMPAVVTEANITYGTDGFQVKAVIGDPAVVNRDPLLSALRQLRSQSQRLGRIERR